MRTDEALGIGRGFAEQQQGVAGQLEPPCEMHSVQGEMRGGEGKVLSVTGEACAR